MNKKSIDHLLLTLLTHQKCLKYILLTLFIGLNIQIVSHAQWITAHSGTTENINKVTYGGGQWVAIGAAGIILTSPDAVTWIARSSGTTIELTGVDYNGTQWIIIGGSGTILTSSDGITWTARNSGTSAGLYSVSHATSQWVITGGGIILTSSDGVTWTPHTSTQLLFNINYHDSLWVGVGGTSILTSLDGITWTTVFTNSNQRQTFRSVSYGEGQWIAVGTYSALIISSNGINWTPTAFSAGTPWLTDVMYGNVWAATSDTGIWISSDGADWQSTTSSLLTYPVLNGIGYGARKWVAVGIRGTIAYRPADALPVSLMSFKAQSEENIVRLTWETAWEKNASHFLIERSFDAKTFKLVGQLSAQGTRNNQQQYVYLDNELASGIWYYRLQQVDLDGSYTHSPIIAVRVGTDLLNGLTLYPNPSLGLIVIEDKIGIHSVHICSLAGVVIHQQVYNQAIKQFYWDGTDIAAGIYLIQVQSKDGRIYTQQWVKL